MAADNGERVVREQRPQSGVGGEGGTRERSPSAPARLSDVNLTVSQTGEARPRPTAWTGESFLGAATRFEGTIRTDETLRVRGTVEGEIASDAEVDVAGTALVKAAIRAAQLQVAGRLEGTVHCAGRVELGASSRVTGEIHAGTLVIQEGALVDGQVRTGPTAPTEESGAPTPSEGQAGRLAK